DTMYVPPMMFMDGEAREVWRIFLDEENPTKKLTLGGLECTLRAEVPAEPPENDGGGVPAKLILKTPMREYTIDSAATIPGKIPQPVELTLDGGRKYFFTAHAFSVYRDKKLAFTTGSIMPGGIQLGKIGPPPAPDIVLFDSNLDGFYTTGDDGIAIGSAPAISGPGGQKLHLVQPLSKYISVAGDIFEIQSVAKDGSELTVLPYTGPTASLEASVPGKHVGQIVLTSDAGLNVTIGGGGGDAVAIVPGSYTVLAAVLVDPEQRSPMMISGGGMLPLKVEAGKKQVLTLSGPKTLEFQASLADGKINIKPDTLHVKGQIGETYKSVPYDYKNPPEVFLNIDGKSISLGKMEFG
ncbi:MAG: hypothetical protein FWD53_06075, partial [Phycisphaerales bacterium]|nr:hypothetical protein [Phycisphaerales bacterium]